ncbi:MAG TPA: copper resistance CopC family protein [Microlunatus sp.]
MSEATGSGHRRLWIVAILMVVAFTVLGTPTAAWAHNALVSTSPGAGKTVAKPPSSIVLTFNEPAIATGTKVLVTGPSGSVTAGDPQLVDTTVEQALQPELAAGDYTVEWRVTSADGHPINGEFSFTVRTGSVGTSTPTPVPTTEGTGSPSVPTGSPSASPSDLPSIVATPLAEPADPGESPRSGWWWLLAVVPVGLAVVLGWRFNRREH